MSPRVGDSATSTYRSCEHQAPRLTRRRLLWKSVSSTGGRGALASESCPLTVDGSELTSGRERLRSRCVRLLGRSALAIAAATLGLAGCGGSAAIVSTSARVASRPHEPAAQAAGPTRSDPSAAGHHPPAAERSAVGAGTGERHAVRRPPVHGDRHGDARSARGHARVTTAAQTTTAPHAPAVRHPAAVRHAVTTPTVKHTAAKGASKRRRKAKVAPTATDLVTTTASTTATTTATAAVQPTTTTTTTGAQPASGGTITLPGTTATPPYAGISPMTCLQQAGLSNVRAGVEAGSWLGDVPGAASDDSNSIVVLSGPYADDDGAAQYAQSLSGVELAVSGGRWVASASLRSNLSLLVQKAASCMGLGS